MDLFEAIRTRRTVRKFNPERPIPVDLANRILTAATWAPNHRRQEPWRFYVIQGPALVKFAEVRAEITRTDLLHLDPEVAVTRIERARNSILRTPLVVVATSKHGENDEHRRDNYCAVCAAVQNLLLTAHGLGLGAVWRTGRLLDNRVKEFVGAGEDETMVAVIYLGYPAADPESDLAERRPLSERVTWIAGKSGWEG